MYEDLSVSIIIPCWNAERWIGEAIESALRQSYPRKEVIVIDDGSTDGSLDVLRKFGNDIQWETGPNRGACAARNRGLQIARGEIIQFLDADDLLHVEKLARQVPLVIEHRPDSVYCDRQCCPMDRPDQVTVFSPSLHGPDPVVFALLENITTPAPIHWKERLLAIGGFREELPCNQEVDLHIRLACAGTRFHHLPEVLYTNRLAPGSIISNQLRLLETHCKVWWPAFHHLQQTGQLTEERTAAFAALMAGDARSYFWNGMRDKALQCFADARKMHPRGGIDAAYQSSLGRIAHRLFGPVAADRIAGASRRVKRLLHRCLRTQGA